MNWIDRKQKVEKGESAKVDARLSTVTILELKVARRERNAAWFRCSCRFKAYKMRLSSGVTAFSRGIASLRRHSWAWRGRAFTRAIFREYYATTFSSRSLGSPAKECREGRELLVTSGMLVIDSSHNQSRASE